MPSRDPCLLHRMVAYGAPGQPDAPLEEDGGAPKRGRGVQQHATSTMLSESYLVNTGEPARDAKDSGEEAGETRTETFKALQAVRLGRVVGVGESHIHGEGPEE